MTIVNEMVSLDVILIIHEIQDQECNVNDLS